MVSVGPRAEGPWVRCPVQDMHLAAGSVPTYWRQPIHVSRCQCFSLPRSLPPFLKINGKNILVRIFLKKGMSLLSSWEGSGDLCFVFINTGDRLAAGGPLLWVGLSEAPPPPAPPGLVRVP